MFVLGAIAAVLIGVSLGLLGGGGSILTVRHPSVVFAKVNTEIEQQLAGELGVQAIPTVLAFRDGVLVFSRAGALSGAALDSLVKQIEALDMAALRREVGQRMAARSRG